MEDHSFLNAYFINEERTVVESLWQDKEGVIRELTIEAREGDPAWENILNHIDIDTLHEMTFKRIRDLDNAYKEQVIAVAKERNMIYDIDSINTEIYKAIAAALFAPFDPVEDKEKLFMFKLQLFEVDAIRECTDKNAKRKIRQAKTMLKACQAAIDICLKNK